MLDECDADYEIIDIDFEKSEHKAPEFLEINPAGKLPALVDGDSRIFETAAICLYLGDKFPEANLAPKIDAPERGRYLSLRGLLDLPTRTRHGRHADGYRDSGPARLDEFRDGRGRDRRRLGNGASYLGTGSPLPMS